MKFFSGNLFKRGFFRFFLPLSFAALAAGFCNGLLGAGGGVILVLAFTYLSKDKESSRCAYANALAVMLPISFLTLLRYMADTDTQKVFSAAAMKELLPCLAGALAGGALGGVLLSKISVKGAKKLFAILTLISGILMLLR